MGLSINQDVNIFKNWIIDVRKQNSIFQHVNILSVLRLDKIEIILSDLFFEALTKIRKVEILNCKIIGVIFPSKAIQL
jgi:hypothetical protein